MDQDWNLRMKETGGTTMPRRLPLWFLGPLICTLLISVTGAAFAAGDELSIRKLEAAQAACWNRHDAQTYAALFAPDADVVNVLGWHWKGRAQLAERLSRAFAGVFRRSTLKIEDIDSRLLRPDIAIAHVRWSMMGALSPDGRAADIPQHGIQTQVLVRNRGGWLIAAFQNTNSVPERPFAAGNAK
jgi:uncharacterized protein (TIGR02246 family)